MQSFRILLPTNLDENDGFSEKDVVHSFHQKLSDNIALQEFNDLNITVKNVKVENIGLGADWTVLEIVGTVLISGFFGIHETHEACKGWKEIGKSFKKIKSFFQKVDKSSSVLYNDDFLYGFALSKLTEEGEDLPEDSLFFIGKKELPAENFHLDISELSPLLFSFKKSSEIKQIALARNGVVLWENHLQLTKS